MGSNKKFGDELRGLMKDRQDGSDLDIGKLWDEQSKKDKKIEKLENDYKNTKKRLRDTRKELLKENFDLSELQIKLVATSRTVWSHTNKMLRQALSWLKSAPKWATIGITVLLVVIVYAGQRSDNQGSETLGSSINGVSSAVDSTNTPELLKATTDSLEFELLYPASSDKELYDIARLSPDGVAPAYTYPDRLSDDGTIFRVTQQQVPPTFSLAQTAEDFQATNVIQVDDNNVIYHGYSGDGRTQSLLFLKKDLLISIRSPEKLSDDQWTGYFLSLQ
jgi:hypothetical protein